MLRVSYSDPTLEEFKSLVQIHNNAQDIRVVCIVHSPFAYHAIIFVGYLD
jgi:hypothetical protein